MFRGSQSGTIQSLNVDAILVDFDGLVKNINPIFLKLETPEERAFMLSTQNDPEHAAFWGFFVLNEDDTFSNVPSMNADVEVHNA